MRLRLADTPPFCHEQGIRPNRARFGICASKKFAGGDGTLVAMTDAHTSDTGPFGIYIHVPFCATRCGYCDFNTYTAGELGGANPEGWLNALRTELAMAGAQVDLPVDTVFVGGGTPSLLGGSGLRAVLDAVRDNFRLDPGAEVTTESNPESTSPEFFAELLDAGYTRISLGMQSTAPHVLAALDRTHSAGRAPAAAREALAAGFRLAQVFEVVAAVRAAVGPDYPIIYRFSQWKGTDYNATLVDDPMQLQELLAPLVDAGVDALHPSTRRHYVPAFPDADPALTLAGWTKKVTGTPVIAVGSVGLQTAFRSEKPGQVIEPGPVDQLVEQFDAGEFDMVAIGRALLADPGWVNRLRSGTLDGFNGYDAASALARLS